MEESSYADLGLNNSTSSSSLADLLAGSLGGACAALAGHPFDTIKVRLQTSTIPITASQCFKQTIVKEGPLAIYKGLLAPLLGSMPLYGWCFYVRSIGEHVQKQAHDDVLKFRHHFYSGFVAGISTAFLVAPVERIKCLLQVQHDKSDTKFTGVTDAFKSLYRTGGIRSVFRGTGATLLRDGLGTGSYFAVYELLTSFISPVDDKSHPSIRTTILAGGLAGCANWLVGLPIDVLKSRIQTAPFDRYPNGLRSAFVDLIKFEQLSALYKGFSPVMTRAFVANAACFSGYEFIMKILSR